jgi:hypothetical protein
MSIEDREWYREAMRQREGLSKSFPASKLEAPIPLSRASLRKSDEAPELGPATLLWLLVVCVVIAVAVAVLLYIRKH